MSAPAFDTAEQFVEEGIRAWNEGEFGGVDEFFAEDVVVHNYARHADYDSREAYKQWVREVREEFSDFNAETADVIVGDDKVVQQWVAKGTNDGPFIGYDFGPTNEFAEWEGASVFRFEDDVVVEAWWYYDLLGMLQQLGVMPGGDSA